VADGYAVQQLYSRIETVQFHSEVLDAPKAFSVVLPTGYGRASASWPVLFLFHGRGRHHLSLIDDEAARAALLTAPFAVVLPDGGDGWYIDSPVHTADRYQAYTEEVIRLSESLYSLSPDPRERGLTGWSMGGYGCVYFAETHPQEYSALAPMIGLLDFPRTGLPKGQSYNVPTGRFGEDPAVWLRFNPAAHVGALREMSILVVTADQSFDRTMNENFSAALGREGIAHQWRVLEGEHTFPVVRRAVPLVLDFMAANLSGSKPSR
jgi:S-formylglutathione hydrolase FrmB